jgi:hypothetical protein
MDSDAPYVPLITVTGAESGEFKAVPPRVATAAPTSDGNNLGAPTSVVIGGSVSSTATTSVSRRFHRGTAAQPHFDIPLQPLAPRHSISRAGDVDGAFAGTRAYLPPTASPNSSSSSSHSVQLVPYTHNDLSAVLPKAYSDYFWVVSRLTLAMGLMLAAQVPHLLYRTYRCTVSL